MESSLSNTNILKNSLLHKLMRAVIFSVLSHVVIVFLYAFVVNFSFDGSSWLKSMVDNVTSITTWLYIIPFSSIIFAQVVICANVYMLKHDYQVTRFQKLIFILSPRTVLIGFLHVIIGSGEIWLYLFISNGRYKDLFVNCNEKVCFSEGSFFLIASGFWIGLFYFISYHTTDRRITFPVVQQWKLPQFKSKFLPMIKQSSYSAVLPTLCYFVLYYLFGHYCYTAFATYFHSYLQIESTNFQLYFSVWIFATLYIINMNLMRFFFELFLTEPFINIDNISLSEALLSRNIPILQHLACLDLYILSKWFPQRRQALFTLSQPGAHPHAWNNLFQSSLQLLLESIEVLNKSIDSLLTTDEGKTAWKSNESTVNRSLQSPLLQNPMIGEYANMHNMACITSAQLREDAFVHTIIEPKYLSCSEMFENASNAIVKLLSKSLSIISNLWFIKYLFGELHETHIQQCLQNGQLIVWTSQGLANIAVASFTEDQYGIVQKDLPILIKVLLDLKQSVEKLNKIPTFARKSNGLDYFSCKMKNYISTGIKLSIGNLCNTFGKYINDISLPKDVVFQLQNYL